MKIQLPAIIGYTRGSLKQQLRTGFVWYPDFLKHKYSERDACKIWDMTSASAHSNTPALDPLSHVEFEIDIKRAVGI